VIVVSKCLNFAILAKNWKCFSSLSVSCNGTYSSDTANITVFGKQFSVVLTEQCLLQIRSYNMEASSSWLQNVEQHMVTSKPSVTVDVPDSADVVIIGKYL
jgi:hypothetical protein